MIALKTATALALALALASEAGAQGAAAPGAAPAPTAAPAPATADAAAPQVPAAAPGAPPASAPAAAVPAQVANGTDIAPDHMENGRWYTKDGIPTFKIENGEIDYATFSGYRRYHAECHVCHGPDGEGSTYAPALRNSVVTNIDYYTFQQIVASGKQDTGAGSANQVMPAFGTNKNVWCYVDDIYVYLLARGTGALPRGRPASKARKTDEFAAQEQSCMGG